MKMKAAVAALFRRPSLKAGGNNNTRKKRGRVG
jgi:hypothetical protein